MARYEDVDPGQRLRADALDVRAEVSPQLRERINASIRAVGQVRSSPPDRETVRSTWWVSGLTGVAAAFLIILLINVNRESSDGSAGQSGEQVSTTVTPEINAGFGALSLKVRTADLTSPLEDELLHLQADFEKAIGTVERDLRSTL